MVPLITSRWCDGLGDRAMCAYKRPSRGIEIRCPVCAFCFSRLRVSPRFRWVLTLRPRLALNIAATL